MKMKKSAALVTYWIAALFCVAVILVSLDYSFPKSVFLASLFMPGAVAAKYFFAQIRFDGSASSIRNAIFLFCAIAVMEFLLVMAGHIILEYMEPHVLYYEFDVASILINPVFVAAIILLLLIGEHAVVIRYSKEKEDERISFTSDRHKVILDRSEIIYVESNDSEVWVHATAGRRFRNKTGISQWENILGDDFIRIHRSYVVKRSEVVSVANDTVVLADGNVIPVSRKYRERVLGLVKAG